MKEIVITSSVLILCIMLIRVIFKGKISSRLQYALWLLVALRLIVPSSAQIHMAIGSLEEFRIMDLVEALEERFGDVTEQLEQPTRFTMSLNSPFAGRMAEFILGEEADIPSSASDGPTSVFLVGRLGVSWLDILGGIWRGGMVIVALWMIITNIIFACRLHKDRKEFALPEELEGICDRKQSGGASSKRIGKAGKIKFYTTNCLTSSCLYGLPGREAIYLTPDITGNQSKLRHVVTHEMCHRKHGDSFWSILRSVLLSVYWMNPLVWVAAVLSKRDCELACDEAALLILGEEERIPYGETLLSIITGKSKLSDIACTATTMKGSGKSVKERIKFIAEKPRALGAAVVAALVLIIVVSVLVFTKQPSFAGRTWEGEIALTAGDMQVRLPETIAGICSYDMAEGSEAIIVYQMASGKEAGRFCALSYDEAAALADEGRKIVPVGNYGTGDMEESKDYLPNEQITETNIRLDPESVTTHSYTPAPDRTEGMIAHEDIFFPEGMEHVDGVPGTDSNEDTTIYVIDDIGSTATASEESRDYLPNEQITEESGDYLPGEEIEEITIYGGDSVTQHSYTPMETFSDRCYIYLKADYAGVKERYLDEMEYINHELEAAAERVVVTSINQKIREDMFAVLAENRTEYLGDASKVGALVSALPQPEGSVYRGITLHTLETEPETALSLEVRYELPAQGVVDTDNDILFFNAAMLFATIRNMDECSFVLTQNDGIPQDDAGGTAGEKREEEYEKVIYNRADLQTSLGTVLWSDEAAESVEAYARWLEDLYAGIVRHLKQ